MIRLKNKVLPVWFQFDGDESQLERAKQSIVEDILHNGLNHYTMFVDIMDQPDDKDKNWDGSVDASVTLTPKAKTNPGLPSSKPNMDKFAESVEDTTDTKVVGSDTKTPKKTTKTTAKTAS